MFFFSLLLVLLGLRLFQLAGLQNEKWEAEATENTIKDILTDAPRGSIFDRNGTLIAGNKTIFSVKMSNNGMTNKEINDSATVLLDILARHEEPYESSFPITMNESGEFFFTYDEEVKQWLAENEMPVNTSAKEAFDEIRRRYSISDDMDRLEAQEELIDRYGLSIPISVTSMEYTQVRQKRDFLQLFSITNGSIDPETAYYEIRKVCELPEEETDGQAMKILSIRYELLSRGFMRYVPATIKRDIKQDTVVEIEEKLHNLKGVSVSTEYERYYPFGNEASHVIGYLGKISDSEKTQYVNELGYRASDLVGRYGVEKAMEEILKGQYGKRSVQVSKTGEIIQEIGSEVKAKQGGDVALTIDINLQSASRDALVRGLEAIRSGGVYKSKYGDYTMNDSYPNAESGAVVVLDVKTGEPLSIVSYPDFDPNEFANGISNEAWNALQSANPRDPLSPIPLYNMATSAAVQPGSTFKPLTAITALESGLDPNRNLLDKGFVEIGDHIYSCMEWNTFGRTHGYVDLYKGMQDSCNFYFYDIATGRDWASGGSDIGYASNISVDKITDYAQKFGLGVESDIEIEETVVSPPTAEKKFESTGTQLWNYLVGECELVFTEEALKDKTEVLKNIDVIVGWMKENPPLNELRSRLPGLGVKEEESQELAEMIKYTYFNFAEWTTGDAFNIAIGQGETAYTPLQMAQYMATIGNGGTLNSNSLIKGTSEKGAAKRAEGTSTGVDSGNLSIVRDAMRRVVTNGSLLRGFSGLPVNVIGKTGTAQRSGKVNPPDEVEYVKAHLGQINPALAWEQVEAEMNRLMDEYPTVYTNPNTAVRRAVFNLSGKGFDRSRIDVYKDTYDDFGWIVALAPAEDPQIAVCVMIVQAGGSSQTAPVAREVIGSYFELQAGYAAEGKGDIDFTSFFKERTNKQ
jgi:penicillin-binding protein 2